MFYIKYNNQWTKSRRILGEYYYEIVQDKKDATVFNSECKARSMMGLLEDSNEIEEGFEVVEEP